jgi:putative transposase
MSTSTIWAVGADPHERTDTSTTFAQRDPGQTIPTTAGDLMVKSAKTRTGAFFPSLLTPRRRIDVALHEAVMEAYVHGVSTRKVDDPVTALGADSGISKSEVSRICAEDTDVTAFNTRDLGEQAFPYVFLRRPTARPGLAATSTASAHGWSPRPWSSPPG